MCLGIPAKLESVTEGTEGLFRSGKVSFGGVSLTVNLALLAEAQPGDYLLVHAGIALSIISEQDARAVFEYLREAGELDEASPPAEDAF
jgi:hydrogenase expression/formation protein HypC